jgi:hypothetical protein
MSNRKYRVSYTERYGSRIENRETIVSAKDVQAAAQVWVDLQVKSGDEGKIIPRVNDDGRITFDTEMADHPQVDDVDHIWHTDLETLYTEIYIFETVSAGVTATGEPAVTVETPFGPIMACVANGDVNYPAIDVRIDGEVAARIEMDAETGQFTVRVYKKGSDEPQISYDFETGQRNDLWAGPPAN